MLAREKGCIFLVEVPDSAAYNKRDMAYKLAKLHINCLSTPLFCVAHRIHRIITLAVDEDRWVGDSHAQAFVGQQPLKRKQVHDAGAKVIDRDLEVFFCEPPPAVTAHVERLLNHTLARHDGIVRGRIVNNEDEFLGRKSRPNRWNQKAPCNIPQWIYAVRKGN